VCKQVYHVPRTGGISEVICGLRSQRNMRFTASGLPSSYGFLLSRR
jgi:hypothetical protein